MSQARSVAALALLEAHMSAYPGQCLKDGTFASTEFNRLYLEWIQARWDEGDTWTRGVWPSRPR